MGTHCNVGQSETKPSTCKWNTHDTCEHKVIYATKCNPSLAGRLMWFLFSCLLAEPNTTSRPSHAPNRGRILKDPSVAGHGNLRRSHHSGSGAPRASKNESFSTTMVKVGEGHATFKTKTLAQGIDGARRTSLRRPSAAIAYKRHQSSNLVLNRVEVSSKD